MFEDIFNAHPDLLAGSDNQPVYDLFKQNNPGVPITKQVKQVCANKKSSMKKKQGIGGTRKGRKGKGRGKGRAAAAAAVAQANNAAVSVSTLESLEDSLENCLKRAEEADARGLSHAIKYLKRARNLVSYRIHQVES
jgi:hypothetical protein